MTRRIIEISLASGIAPDVWWQQDWRTIATAIELLSQTAEGESQNQGRVVASG